MLAMALCSYGGCVKRHERVNAFILVVHGMIVGNRVQKNPRLLKKFNLVGLGFCFLNKQYYRLSNKH